MTDDTLSPLNNVITIDDERIRNHLDRVVRGSVEETLNALLEAEADRLCNAQRYERTEVRRDTRAGHYERKLQTKAGEVRLKVPKLRAQTFETAIIERYRRRESSVEEALIEMYLAGVSVRRVEDITEALWGTRASPATVSPQQEDLRDDRGLAQPADRRRASLCLSGRHRAEAQLGGRSAQCLAAGCDRRDQRRLSGDSRHLRRCQGGQGGLELRSSSTSRNAALRACSSSSPTPACGLAESAAEYLSQRALATLHRALVPQHLQPCADDQGARDRGHAQGDPRQENIVAAREKAIRVIEKICVPLRLNKAAELASKRRSKRR